MKGEYMWNTGRTLDHMRLTIEGAVLLFENDACPLAALAKENQAWLAYAAFNTIGEALYVMQQQIRELHEAHAKEVQRQLTAGDET